jgi:hypothetical protein
MGLAHLFVDFLQQIAIGVVAFVVLLLVVRFRTGTRAPAVVRRTTE